MKKYIFTLILLTCSQVTFANTNDTCENLSLKEKVSEIRKNYTDINKNLEYYNIQITPLYESTEGGRAVDYVNDKGEIVKRIETYYGEMGRFVIEYYFYQGDIRFIFTVDINYNAHITSPDFNQFRYTINENRYYFYCNRMIKWLDQDKKAITPNSKKFSEREQELLNDMQDNTKEFDKKEQELLNDMQDNHIINQDNEQVRRIFL